MAKHSTGSPDLDEQEAKKTADRLVGTLLQTYLSQPVTEIIRNSIMANHAPVSSFSLEVNYGQRVRCELVITPYEGAHAEAFPLHVELRTTYGHTLGRHIYAVVNASPVFNARYIVTNLRLDIDTGAVTFEI